MIYLVISKRIFYLILFIGPPSLLGQSLNTILYDMVGPIYRSGAFGAPWGKHEAPLNGVPLSYDWADGARPGAWISGVQSGTYLGTTMWGQVYVQQGGSPETDFRVQIRNLAYYAYRNNQWELILSTPNNIGGTYFLEDFTANISPTGIRDESANGGGISVEMIPNYTFHWWNDRWPRAEMPLTATAVFARAEVRVIHNVNHSVDLTNVKVLAATGIDAYPTVTSTGQFITSLGIPRHKFVTPDWQYFTFYVAGNPMPATLNDFINEVNNRPLPPNVSASCDIVLPTTTIISTCNNNGTIGDQSDDYRTFSIIATGTGVAPTFQVTVSNGGTLTPTSGNFGSSSTFRLQNGSAGNGNTYTLTLTDTATSPCTTTATINDPGYCSSGPTCTTITNVATIIASSATDPDASNNEDTADVSSNCTSCSINTPTVTPTCSDNGTPSDPADDTFTFTISAAGTGVGANYKVDKISPAPTATLFPSLTYGTTPSAASPAFPISGGNLTLTLTDNTTATCTNTPVTVTAPPTCSNITPQADLELTKTASSPIVRPGEALTFTLTLVNKGPGTANGVVVRDVIPPSLTFVSATTATGSYNNATGLWTLGDLPPGTYTLTINVTVN
ncbi:MAG: DUF11 domain-containing protein [Bacteroidetes Order II. Incertae sedis bacterium]|nr:DUF11 domain-containing protein [Bacteroidetes Order II. bacterium]